jgi:hypothetical protein
MTRGEMLAELRTVLDDESGRPKWGTSLLLGWMAEGQDIFCEETGYFVDFTSHTLDTVVDQSLYSIPDRTIQVLNIWNGNVKLAHVQEYMKTYPAQSNQSITFNPDSQTPYAWQADQESGAITLIPTPQEAITLNLHVWRYPEFSLDDTDVDGSGTDAEPEIPARFHRACIEYAAYKAYSNHDAETGDTMSAKDHYAMFRQYVSAGKKARRRFISRETKVGGNSAYLVR